MEVLFYIYLLNIFGTLLNISIVQFLYIITKSNVWKNDINNRDFITMNFVSLVTPLFWLFTTITIVYVYKKKG